MTRSRREVLISGGVIGAGVVAADFSILQAFAGPLPPRRKTLAGLAWNDPVVETYRDAVKIMQGKPANDPFNWTTLAHIHGKNEFQYHFCPHGNWYFLPWHRAYVVTYEKAVRQITGNTDFAMPYWDWTTNPKMPEQFLSPTLPNNQPNALYVSGSHARTWPDAMPMPNNIVGPQVYQTVMQTTPYEAFGTSRPAGQNSLAQSWITDGSGFQGPLEQTPHNNVHNNIGGWMPSAMSPMDPIFFMHHSNIDRIWDAWNHAGNPNSPDPLWTDMTFQNNFINPDGTPWSPQVKSLYVPEELGYTYQLGYQLAYPGKNLVLIENKLVRLIKFLKNPGGPVEGIAVFGLERANIQPMNGKAALSLAVRANKDLVARVRGRQAPLRASGGVNFREQAEARAAGTHAYAFLTNVDATSPENAEFRVFLNADNPTPATPLSDPHYVGNFAIFNHGMKSHAGMMPSFMIDVTDAVQRVGGAGDTLDIQIVPVPNRRGVDAGSVNVERVQVAFVTP
ncbi:MAG TPA: tyrosinase family protein [Rhizomicrobium sp.]